MVTDILNYTVYASMLNDCYDWIQKIFMCSEFWLLHITDTLKENDPKRLHQFSSRCMGGTMSYENNVSTM